MVGGLHHSQSQHGIKVSDLAVAGTARSRIPRAHGEPIFSKWETLVPQRTERSWVLASGSMKKREAGDQGINFKGSRVRGLGFSRHATPACAEKVDFNDCQHLQLSCNPVH
jgi:hypothetical protein